MVFILSIETSTPICSIALHQNGELIDSDMNDGKGAHSELLVRMISDLLDRNEIKPSSLSAIAVSEGPGSYTGLRIGVSTSKGLAFAWDLPLIGISTLKILAKAAIHINGNSGFIIPLLDARRMEVYREVFDSELKSLAELDSEVVDEFSFQEWLKLNKVCFVGDGANKVKEVITHSNAIFSSLEISAKDMGSLAYLKFSNRDFEDLAYFVPNYLKEFKALQSKKNPLMS